MRNSITLNQGDTAPRWPAWAARAGEGTGQATRMYRLILVTTFSLLLALALACAGLAWWGAGQARFQLERTRLAHEVLEEHLRLKITADALLREAALGAIAENGRPFDAADARARIREHFRTLREGIAREVALLPNDAGERRELEELATLEVAANGVLDRLEEASRLYAAGRAPEARALLQTAMLHGFGEAFCAAVDEAVAEEREEADEAKAEAGHAMALVSLLSRIAAFAALPIAVLALLLLVRRLQRPLDRLVEAANGIAAGDLSRRMPAGPPNDEFARVAQSFNAMVEEVARSRAELEGGRAELEQAVAARTAELAAANATLKRGDDARRRFLADVSHELRTPLTVMRGEAEIALRIGRSTEEYRSALERVAAEAAHTGRLVDDLLYVARSEAGEPRAVTQTVAFDEVVRRATAAAQTLAEARDIRITLREVLADPVVRGDPDRLRQLVLILLDNAARYSDPGGEVVVTLAAAVGGGLLLSVADRGMGIAADELERVFERFYRGDGAGARHVEGSGLGLPLARAIARAHGGELRLESTQGEGTTALLTLPVVRRLRVVA